MSHPIQPSHPTDVVIHDIQKATSTVEVTSEPTVEVNSERTSNSVRSGPALLSVAGAKVAAVLSPFVDMPVVQAQTLRKAKTELGKSQVT